MKKIILLVAIVAVVFAGCKKTNNACYSCQFGSTGPLPKPVTICESDPAPYIYLGVSVSTGLPQFKDSSGNTTLTCNPQ